MNDDEGRYAEYHIGWQEGYAEAAAEIAKLRAALSDIYEITSRAGHLVDAVKRVAAAALNDVKSDKS